jgi:hypothetical protein
MGELGEDFVAAGPILQDVRRNVVELSPAIGSPGSRIWLPMVRSRVSPSPWRKTWHLLSASSAALFDSSVIGLYR